MKKRQKRGQTMMEYILLVALLAVGSIPVITILGDIFRDRVMNSAERMVGEEVYKNQSNQIVSGGQNKVRKDMKTFHED